MKVKDRAAAILEQLAREFPEPRCALHHKNAFELVVATILSAQCTDERVNLTTPALFKKYPTPAKMAAARTEDVEELVRSTGFYRNKAKSIIGAAHRITETFGGKVPRTMDELLSLPGVARKTANVVLGNAYGINVGVVVDTHVQRLSRRMGLTKETTPEKIEQDLMKLFPREEWTNLSHRLILHGRDACNARAPECSRCVVGVELCPSWNDDPGYWKAQPSKEVGLAAARKRKTAGKKAAKTRKAKK